MTATLEKNYSDLTRFWDGGHEGWSQIFPYSDITLELIAVSLRDLTFLLISLGNYSRVIRIHKAKTLRGKEYLGLAKLPLGL